MTEENKPLLSKTDMEDIAKELSDMSLQDRLTIASGLLDNKRFDLALSLLKVVVGELDWYVCFDGQIISHGGAITFCPKGKTDE